MNSKLKAFLNFNLKGMVLTGLFVTIGIYPKVSITQSLTHNFFVTSRLKRPIHANDYVILNATLPGQTQPISVVKQVVGMPGDRIEIRKKHCFVNQHSIGEVLDTTHDGYPLMPIQTKRVPEGYLFVAGTNKRSFDSRYEAFGLVKISEVNKVYAVF